MGETLQKRVNVRSLPAEFDGDLLKGITRIGSYQIDKKTPIGIGSTGYVLRARSKDQHRVALKLGFSSDPRAYAHHMEAARLQDRVASVTPHVPQVHETIAIPAHRITGEKVKRGQREGSFPLVVMEYVPGHPYSRILKRVSQHREREAIQDLWPIAVALDAAHEVGVVHRDVHSDNIVGPQKALKLVDFDIAVENGTRLVKEDAIGTLGYVAREQATVGAIQTGAIDIWQLGATLFEGVTDRQLFEVPDLKTNARVFKDGYATRLSARLATAGLSTPVQDVFMRAEASEPADRYPLAESLMYDFARAAGIPATTYIDLHPGQEQAVSAARRTTQISQKSRLVAAVA